MGTVKLTIEIGDPKGRQFEELDVTVGTRSAYTAVPRAMLHRLGVPVHRTLQSETPDGRIIPVDVGQTTIRMEGLEFHTQVIFAEPGEPSLLGKVTLEEAALTLDPGEGRLISKNLLRISRTKPRRLRYSSMSFRWHLIRRLCRRFRLAGLSCDDQPTRRRFSRTDMFELFPG